MAGLEKKGGERNEIKAVFLFDVGCDYYGFLL